jgi:hypothetical protein
MLGCGTEGPTQPNPTPGVLTLTVDPDDTVVLLGGTVQLTATITDEDGNPVTQAVSWSSSDANTASVGSSTGVVTGVAEGSVTITATSGDLSEDAVVDVTPEAAFDADVQPIFTASCALSGCHLAPNPQQGMDLSDGEAYANIVNVPSVESALDRIEPGDPEASYLVHKLLGTQTEVGGSGEQMPLTGGPLMRATINVVRSWVRAGAQNN